MKNDAVVFISSAAYQSLMVSATEVYPRETDGVIVGRVDDHGNYHVTHAHPYQTAHRLFESVDQGNQRAVHRMNNLLTALNGHPERPHIIGGYHSHPQRKVRMRVAPSKDDLKEVQETLLPRHKSLDRWLELIVRVASPHFCYSGPKGAVHFRRLKKLATTARYESQEGFNFITGAFLIEKTKDQGYSELRVELTEHI